MSSSQNTHQGELSEHIRAVHQQTPAPEQTEQAQHRLIQRLTRQAKRPSPATVRWQWAPALALALFLVPILVLLPGEKNGVAFARVQAHFNTFDTLQAQLNTRLNGNTIMTMNIAVDRDNRTRIDSGDQFSFIIDPGQQRMLQLFHPQRRAAFVALAGSKMSSVEMDWLDELREYQGQAQRLDATRRINGIEAVGFLLEDAALSMTLWASENARPVLLEISPPGPGQPSTDIAFRFDQALDSARFQLAVPEGYRLGGAMTAD